MTASITKPTTPAVVSDDAARATTQIRTGHHADAARRGQRERGSPTEWTLIMTLGGTAVPGRRGSSRELVAGDLLLVSPAGREDYAAAPGSEWERIHAAFQPRAHWLPWMRWPAIGDGVQLIHLGDDAIRGHARAAMLRCHAYVHAPAGAFAHELAMSALEEAILLGAHEAIYHAAPREGAAPMRPILEHIAANLRRAHTVTSLARLARLSPSRFAHLFKDEVGEPVIAYVNRMRLHEAARLLEAGDLSVKATAEAVGFGSPFHFSRQFKKLWGLDPSSFRRRAEAKREG